MFKKLLFTGIIILASSDIFCSDYTFAFGYLKNSSGDPGYNYLETVFSNSIVSSLAGKDITLIRASDINTKLKSEKMTLQSEYDEKGLIKLCDTINADYFMYGKFIPLDGYYVRLIINIYCRNTNELFTFETIGRLETEIFSLVDILSAVLFNATSERVFYKKDVIAENSRLGIISNLNPTELNEMYSVFMDKKYEISVIQSSYLENIVDTDEMEIFYNIISSKNSLKKFKDEDLKKEMNFVYGSWLAKDEFDFSRENNNFINFYYYDYPESKQDILKKISKSTKNNDYLMMIYFNKKRTKAFIRCIDFKTGNLIWMERNISPGKDSRKKYKSKIMQTTDEIIKHFFITSSEPVKDN